jgi:hypothetical protein
VDPLTAECDGKRVRTVTALRLSADRQTTANRVCGQLSEFHVPSAPRNHPGMIVTDRMC